MNVWDKFFEEKCIDLFDNSKSVLDIGEGLRARKETGSKYDSSRAWLKEYIEKVDYTVMDPVPDYGPDIVGDIHAIPLTDNSVDAIICLAVLEHVKDPVRAMEEMHRVLKPGGRLLIYVPFLYYYHAHEGYYEDYWRFTKDTLEHLAKPFSRFDYVHVRDRIEMIVRLTPLGRSDLLIAIARKFDQWIDKKPKVQVGGFYYFLEK